MIEIPLTQGYVALIDDQDWEQTKFKWCADVNKKTVYARRSVRINGKDTKVRLHRSILGITDPRIQVDHEDHNGLNCRRYNLRVASDEDNAHNQQMHYNNTSGYIGVCWQKNRQRWIASIKLNNRSIHLGYFDSVVEAAMARDKAALELHGSFANLNFKEAA